MCIRDSYNIDVFVFIDNELNVVKSDDTYAETELFRVFKDCLLYTSSRARNRIGRIISNGKAVYSCLLYTSQPHQASSLLPQS